MTDHPRELLEVGSFQHTPGLPDTPSQMSSSRSAGQSAGPNTATAPDRRTLLEASNTSNTRHGDDAALALLGHVHPQGPITTYHKEQPPCLDTTAQRDDPAVAPAIAYGYASYAESASAKHVTHEAER